MQKQSLPDLNPAAILHLTLKILIGLFIVFILAKSVFADDMTYYEEEYINVGIISLNADAWIEIPPGPLDDYLLEHGISECDYDN